MAQYADRRVLFWGSAAPAAVIAVLIWFLVPSTPASAKGRRFDAAGAAGLGAGLACLLLAVSKGGRVGLEFGRHARPLHGRRPDAAGLGSSWAVPS